MAQPNPRLRNAPTQRLTIPTHAHVISSDIEPDCDTAVTRVVPTQPAPQQTLPPAPAISRTASDLNLSVLRRHDPAILSILSIAPYAVIYTFSIAASTWEKSGVEGALFVCSLADSIHPDTGAAITDRSAVFVLNRRGLENFSLELVSAENVEITAEYVILQGGQVKDGTPIIYGLWIYAEQGSSTAEMRGFNAATIQACAARAELGRNVAVAEAQISAASRHDYTDPAGSGLQRQQGQWQPQSQGHSISINQLFGNSWPANPIQHQRPLQLQSVGVGGGGSDVLGDLFRRARQDYHSAL